MEARSVDDREENEVAVLRASDAEILAHASSILKASGIAFRVTTEGGGHFGRPEHVFRLLVRRGSEDAARQALGNLPSEDIDLIERNPPPEAWRSVAWAYIVAIGVFILLAIAAVIWERLR